MHKKLTVQSPSSLQVPEAKERWLHCQQARTPYRNNLRSSKAWGRRTSAPRKFLDKRNVFDGIKKNKLASNVGMDNQHLDEIAWSNLQNKHCQRHNGPEGWVLLAKVTSLGQMFGFMNKSQLPPATCNSPICHLHIPGSHQSSLLNSSQWVSEWVSESLTSIPNDRTRVR